jgi:fucose permease
LLLRKTILYFLSGALQGICLISFPASSFIWRHPEWTALSDQQYGACFFPVVGAAIVASLLSRRLAGIVGKHRLYLGSLLSNGIYLIILLGTVHFVGNMQLHFSLLLLANLFLGFGLGASVSVLGMLIIDLYPTRRDLALVGLHAGFGVGATVAPLMVSTFFQQGIWYRSFEYTLVLLVMIFLAAMFTPDEPNTDDRKVDLGVKTSLAPGPLPWGARFFILATVLYGVVEAVIGNWSISFLSEDRGLSVEVATRSLSLFWASLTVGRLFATALVLRISPKMLYWLSPVVIMGGIFLMIRSVSEHEVAMSFIISGLGCSYFFPLSISLATGYYDRWREGISGLTMTGLMVGVGLGSFSIGFMKGLWGMPLSFAFIIALFCAAGLWVISMGLMKMTLIEPTSGTEEVSQAQGSGNRGMA